jgi:hypothetical protein
LRFSLGYIGSGTEILCNGFNEIMVKQGLKSRPGARALSQEVLYQLDNVSGVELARNWSLRLLVNDLERKGTDGSCFEGSLQGAKLV